MNFEKMKAESWKHAESDHNKEDNPFYLFCIIVTVAH